jgi:colicin import membrane protein
MTSPTFENGYSGKEPKFYSMILFSLIAHFLVITIVFVSLPSASRHLTFGPVYSVSLVSSEAVSPRNQESSLFKEIKKSSEAANSVIYKKEISGISKTPVKKEEINKLNIEKAVSAIKEKQLGTPEPTSSVRTNLGNQPTKMTAGDKAAKANEYTNIVSAKVHNNWSIPPELKPRGNIVTIIEIKIMRDGSLAYAGFEKRSGNSFYDESAMKAVKKSAPFPPLPGGFSDNIMEIGIRFHPSQLR